MVEARLNGRPLSSTIADKPRPDLGALFPDEGNGPTCGFALRLPPQAEFGLRVVEIALWARHPADDDQHGAEFARVTFAGRDAVPGALSAAGIERDVGPFPRQVANIVNALWPDVAAADLDQESAQAWTQKIAVAGKVRRRS